MLVKTCFLERKFPQIIAMSLTYSDRHLAWKLFFSFHCVWHDHHGRQSLRGRQYPSQDALKLWVAIKGTSRGCGFRRGPKDIDARGFCRLRFGTAEKTANGGLEAGVRTGCSLRHGWKVAPDGAELMNKGWL